MTSMRTGSGMCRSRQTGAVLYIALILLLLLAILGIVGMQVATMQERMSSNYRAANVSFQQSEALARSVECTTEDLVNRTTTTGCNVIAEADIDQVCENGFDPGGWARAQAAQDEVVDAVTARLIGPCITANASLDMGQPVNEDPNPIYQITVFGTDGSGAASSATAIDTIFRP